MSDTTGRELHERIMLGVENVGDALHEMYVRVLWPEWAESWPGYLERYGKITVTLTKDDHRAAIGVLLERDQDTTQQAMADLLGLRQQQIAESSSLPDSGKDEPRPMTKRGALLKRTDEEVAAQLRDYIAEHPGTQKTAALKACSISHQRWDRVATLMGDHTWSTREFGSRREAAQRGAAERERKRREVLGQKSEEPLYTRSEQVSLIRQVGRAVVALKANNGRNKFARNVQEMLACGDPDTLAQLESILRDALAYLEDLRMIATDEQQRQWFARGDVGRDDMPDREERPAPLSVVS